MQKLWTYQGCDFDDDDRPAGDGSATNDADATPPTSIDAGLAPVPPN